jgi:hypothetical protein
VPKNACLLFSCVFHQPKHRPPFSGHRPQLITPLTREMGVTLKTGCRAESGTENANSFFVRQIHLLLFCRFGKISRGGMNAMFGGSLIRISFVSLEHQARFW